MKSKRFNATSDEAKLSLTLRKCLNPDASSNDQYVVSQNATADSNDDDDDDEVQVNIGNFKLNIKHFKTLLWKLIPKYFKNTLLEFLQIISKLSSIKTLLINTKAPIKLFFR